MARTVIRVNLLQPAVTLSVQQSRKQIGWSAGRLQTEQRPSPSCSPKTKQKRQHGGPSFFKSRLAW